MLGLSNYNMDFKTQNQKQLEDIKKFNVFFVLLVHCTAVMGVKFLNVLMAIRALPCFVVISGAKFSCNVIQNLILARNNYYF